MTKQTPDKRAARVRQQRFGGSYQGHLNLIRQQQQQQQASKNQIYPAITMNKLEWIARDEAPKALAAEQPGSQHADLVFLILDAADPSGASICAASISRERGLGLEAARTAVVREAEEKHAAGEFALFGELLKRADLADLLTQALPSESRRLVTEIEDHAGAVHPPNGLQFLAVAEGKMHRAWVPREAMCLCGHPASQHSENGCGWFDVPTGEPMIGMGREMVAFARARGIPIKCPCGGNGKNLVMTPDGRFVHGDTAILVWPDDPEAEH